MRIPCQRSRSTDLWAAMSQIYTAVVKRDREWWIGWVEEVLSEALVIGAGYEEFAPLLKALATGNNHCRNELPS